MVSAGVLILALCAASTPPPLLSSAPTSYAVTRRVASVTSVPSRPILSTAPPSRPVPSAAPSSPPAPPPAPSADPIPAPPPPPSPAPDPLTVLIDAMSPEQLVGQLILLEWTRHGTSNDGAVAAVQAIHGGGVVLLGEGWTPEQTLAASQALQASMSPTRVGAFIATDQEGGAVQRIGGAGMDAIPRATVQGSWPAPDLAAQAAVWGAQLRATGENVNLAPVVDTVPADMAGTNPPIGGLGREFGGDPVVVGQSSAAFVTGMNQAGVLACLKHFPGLGRVDANTDIASATDTATTATDPFVGAFRTALDAGPGMVMVSGAVYAQLDPDHQAIFSPAVITGLLRDQMGWDGIVLADAMSAQAVADRPPGQAAVEFVAAGGDLMLFDPAHAVEAQQALLAAMASSPGFQAQVRASVVRILTTKVNAGLVALPPVAG